MHVVHGTAIISGIGLNNALESISAYHTCCRNVCVYRRSPAMHVHGEVQVRLRSCQFSRCCYHVGPCPTQTWLRTWRTAVLDLFATADKLQPATTYKAATYCNPLLAGKDISAIRVVVCGCGAAGFTCAKYFVSLGVQQQNLIAVDVKVSAAAVL